MCKNSQLFRKTIQEFIYYLYLDCGECKIINNKTFRIKEIRSWLLHGWIREKHRVFVRRLQPKYSSVIIHIFCILISTFIRQNRQKTVSR